MAGHDPIPQRVAVTNEKGILSRAWYQFLYKIFGNMEKRLQVLEAAKDDHETRITALEP